MGELGEFLGWLTGVCFAAAVLNYVVKRVNRRWIAPLPKESPVRRGYQPLMRLVVQYHRYFGVGAAVVAASHLIMQIQWAFPSVTGIIAASLLIVTAVLGSVLLCGHKRKLIVPHRIFAAAGFAAFVLHLLLKQ